MEPKKAGRTAEQVNKDTRTDHSNGARELHTSGFVAGTLIMTAKGELPVEYLNPGDRIASRNRGLVRLQGIHQSSDILEPIHMSAHALGSDQPRGHLSLRSDQPVLLRNWLAKALRGAPQAAINAENLVNGETIVRSTKRRITFLHLQFDAPQIIYANRLEVIVEHERVASLTK